MQDWEKALKKFTDTWEPREEVTGFLVCGSYVTGNPTEHSDIDLHIILDDTVDWRERGNRIIDSYLVEYFANSPDQIRKYYREDYEGNRMHSQTQFATGRILLDRDGTVAQMKDEAEEWLDKPFKPLDETSVEILKYMLWDTLDNLRDLHERESKSFTYAYHDALRQALSFYSRFLGVEIPSLTHVHEYLTDQETRGKYLQPEFPDSIFSNLFTRAITATSPPEMMNCFEEIADHIYGKTGEFKIDGWKIRTPTTIH
jgi:predicted nucleotidyltransferase